MPTSRTVSPLPSSRVSPSMTRLTRKVVGRGAGLGFGAARGAPRLRGRLLLGRRLDVPPPESRLALGRQRPRLWGCLLYRSRPLALAAAPVV